MSNSLIRAHKKSQVVFMFDEEYGLSIIWGQYAYCGDYPETKYPTEDPDNIYGEKVESKDVEIMPYGEKFIKWMQKNYDGYDVFGYIPVSELPKIISKCQRLAPKPQSKSNNKDTDNE